MQATTQGCITSIPLSITSTSSSSSSSSHASSWRRRVEKPIFATPCACCVGVIVATVGGQVKCVSRDGDDVWMFQAGAAIFSSPIVIISSFSSFPCFTLSSFHSFSRLLLPLFGPIILGSLSSLSLTPFPSLISSLPSTTQFCFDFAFPSALDFDKLYLRGGAGAGRQNLFWVQRRPNLLPGCYFGHESLVSAGWTKQIVERARRDSFDSFRVGPPPDAHSLHRLWCFDCTPPIVGRDALLIQSPLEIVFEPGRDTKEFCGGKRCRCG